MYHKNNSLPIKFYKMVLANADEQAMSSEIADTNTNAYIHNKGRILHNLLHGSILKFILLICS